jgi:hypothetical protein
METLSTPTIFYYWDKLFPEAELSLVSSVSRLSASALLGLYPCGEPKGDNTLRLKQLDCCKKLAEDTFAAGSKPLSVTEEQCLDLQIDLDNCIFGCGGDTDCEADCRSSRNRVRPDTSDCEENEKKLEDLQKQRDADYAKCKANYGPIEPGKPKIRYIEVDAPTKYRYAPPWVNPSGEPSRPPRSR